jgi:hypothetical protein
LPTEPRYRYVLWCRDCDGDEHGCFGGGEQPSGDTFASREDAEEAARKATDDGQPWQYRIEALEEEFGA